MLRSHFSTLPHSYENSCLSRLKQSIGAWVHFHPSLWLSESHELLVTQSHHGIDSGGAARWQVGGRQGDRQQDCSRDAEAHRIGRANSEEPGAQQSRCCKRQCRAEYHSGQYHAESLAEKKVNHIAPLGSKGNAHANLLGPAAYFIRNDAVEAHPAEN